MDNIVYILGAGFSAPLGLPVISNFISKAHDIYQDNREDYPHFGNVFQSIKSRLASIALIYQANLENIEEVLSILEMERLTGGVSTKDAEDLNKFIVDVIKYYSPPRKELKDAERVSEGVYKTQKYVSIDEFRKLVYLSHGQESYIKFVCELLNVEVVVEGIQGEEKRELLARQVFDLFSIKCVPLQNFNAKYSVVSLNYDLVLEDVASYYSNISSGCEIGFSRPQGLIKDGLPMLAKLHGSIDTETIIPPTWNKSLREKIDLEWKEAHKVLSSANQIRFVGYSLPDGDAYVKYLLKSSVMQSEHLKKIDVICLDSDGTVKARFDDFIAPQYESRYRFANRNVTSYLKDFGSLEQRHQNIMENNPVPSFVSSIGD